MTAPLANHAGAASMGLAMSGGGYRATAWGLGATLAIADLAYGPASMPTQTQSPQPALNAIASVSGGSIANAWMGLASTGASRITSSAGDEATAALGPKLVGRKLPWFVGLVVLLGVSIVVPWFLRDAIPHDLVRYAVTTGAAILASTIIGVRAGDLLFGWWASWIYVGVLVAALVGTGWIMFLPTGTASRLGWAALALFAAGAIAQLRPYVVQGALARLFKQSALGGKPAVRALGSAQGVHHVICITELEGNNLLYAGTDMVYSSNFGANRSPTLTAAAATQASANFPGGFPIRWLNREDLGLSDGKATMRRALAVTDGGAYDNMGSHWFTGLADRVGRMRGEGPEPSAIADQLRVPDLLCIANASALTKISHPAKGSIPLIGEVLGLLRVKTVLYEQTTAPRRRELVERFMNPADPLKGVIVHIATSPERSATAAGNEGVVTRLRARYGDVDWDALAAANAAVATTLWPVGTKIIDLLFHSYVLTAVQMHLYLGTPLRLPPRQEFDDLVSAGTQRAHDACWAAAGGGVV